MKTHSLEVLDVAWAFRPISQEFHTFRYLRKFQKNQVDPRRGPTNTQNGYPGILGTIAWLIIYLRVPFQTLNTNF